MLSFLKDLNLLTCLQNKEASAAEKSPERILWNCRYLSNQSTAKYSVPCLLRKIWLDTKSCVLIHVQNKAQPICCEKRDELMDICSKGTKGFK